MTMKSTDKKILGLLLKDARISQAQISEIVGLSRPAVAERIKKLEQSGVIQAYTAVVSPAALGNYMTAFIAAKQVGIPRKVTREDIMALSQDERILEVHDTAGEDCFLLKVRVPDVHALNEIVKRLAGPPLSMTTKTTIALDSYFEKVGGAMLAPQRQHPGG